MNLVVADLLRLRLNQNRNAKITPFLFYHPGPKNTMEDDVSRRLDLNNKSFLYLFYYRYSPQSAGSWIICHLPTEMLSFVIYALIDLLYAAVTCQTSAQPPSMQIGVPSDLTSASTISSITLTTQWSTSFKCLDTGFRTFVNP